MCQSEKYSFTWKDEADQLLSPTTQQQVGDTLIERVEQLPQGTYTLTATDANFNATEDNSGCAISHTNISSISAWSMLDQSPPITPSQGRRQEFFQGRALGGSPAIFQFPGEGGLNPDFWSLQWSK